MLNLSTNLFCQRFVQPSSGYVVREKHVDTTGCRPRKAKCCFIREESNKRIEQDKMLKMCDFHNIGNNLDRTDSAAHDGQPCGKLGFRKGFNATGYMRWITRFIEVTREYRRPLRIAFINLSKRFDPATTVKYMLQKWFCIVRSSSRRRIAQW